MAQSALQPKEELQKQDLSKQYFNRCMETPDPHQSEASQADMCLCQSLYMSENLPVEQMQTMATGTRDGGAYVDKKTLFLDVFAPCLEFPAGEMARLDCYNDPLIRSLVSTQNAYYGTCNCVKREAEAYFREMARPQLAAIMKRTPTLEDPLGTIRVSLEYMTDIASAKQECVNLYQKEWEKKQRR